MNPGVRARALSALLELGETGRLPPRASFKDSRDGRLYTELTKGVLRNRIRLDAAIERHAQRPTAALDSVTTEILRLGAYEIMYLRIPAYATVNEAVSLSRRHSPKASGLVNAVLRRISEDTSPPALIESLSDIMPEELAKRFEAILGRDRLKKAVETMQTEAPLGLRANPLKTSVSDLHRVLEDAGCRVHPSDFVPDTLLICDNPPLETLSAFNEGHFYIQNEASQLPVFMLGALPGERVMDACCGPGGKSTQIAESTGGEAKILAVDRNPGALRSLEENIRRLNLRNIALLEADLLRGIDKPRAPIDRILLDAPCSAWGVLRQHPEWRWTKDAQDVKVHARAQFDLLRIVLRYLKPKGTLVYSVCTFSPEETKHTVQKLLTAVRDLEIEDPRPHLPEGSRRFADDRFVQTYPGDGDMDGFFAVRLRKR